MSIRWSYRILRVWGIPIKLHVSLILIIPFLQWDFGWAPAIMFGIGIFASITLHELGHCFVAMRKGCRVREILLLPIGGVASMESMPIKPLDEIKMAIAGPLVSLALFLIFFFGGWLIPLPHAVISDRHTYGALRWNMLQLVGLANLGFVLFNLIPAFPMDGGRFLRAWLMPRLGRLRATLVAATIGKAFAVVFGVVGYRYDLWTLVLIAVFIYFAAGLEYRAVEQLERLRAFGFMTPEPPETGRGSMREQAVIGPPPYEKEGKSTTAAPIVRERDGRFDRNPWVDGR